MRINRELLGWGVFFITLGVVPLAVRAGALDEQVARRAWELWPLILVGLGLGLLLKRTPAAAVGGLLVALTFGLMGGGLLAGGLPTGGFTACGSGTGGGQGTAFPVQTGNLGLEAEADLELNCGTLVVTSEDGTGWTVAGTADGGRPPEIQSSDAHLRVRSPDRPGVSLGVAGSTWNITLPRQVSLSLDLSLNAGSARLDLAAMRVPELMVSVNAGDATIDATELMEARSVRATVNAGSLSISLPSPASTLGGELSVNAGSIEVCVPDSVGLRFRMRDDALGSNNFEDQGLVRTGDTWTRPGFDAAARRIELAASANLGSITLNPEDGCE